MGDWNVDVNEMQQMSFDEEVQGEWLANGEATIQTGNELGLRACFSQTEKLGQPQDCLECAV